MKKNCIVYFHKRKDTGEVFYVGIGDNFARSKSKKSRNEYWHNIVNKVGYTIEIIHTDLTWEDASKIEIDYIKQFGRADLGLGNLVNMTDGGDGHKNPSKETRKKISEGVSGKNHGQYGKPRPKSVKDKISEANKGDKNYWRNNPMSLEHRNKLSKAKKGKRAKNAKLTDDQVLWIRENYIPRHKLFSAEKISVLFGVSANTIRSVVNKISYSNV